MVDKSLPEEKPEKVKQAVWRFAHLFRRNVSDEEQESASPSDAHLDLIKDYPDNALEIIDFLAQVLRRRQPIVEHLEKYPELNDHGFFMVICKLYRDTYHGVGHTNDRITGLIAMFSTTDISRATAARILKKANTAEVFTSIRDSGDKRKQRYYLHSKMIRLCSESFGGMFEDVISATTPVVKNTIEKKGSG